VAVGRQKTPRIGALILLHFREGVRVCIGFPMSVLTCGDGVALCERRGDTRLASMLLIGAQAPGAKALVYLGSAPRLLDEAAQIDDVLDALSEVLEERRSDRPRAGISQVFALIQLARATNSIR
jgi:hydrogenase assembly chaperone HypC/HupF